MLHMLESNPTEKNSVSTLGEVSLFVTETASPIFWFEGTVEVIGRIKEFSTPHEIEAILKWSVAKSFFNFRHLDQVLSFGNMAWNIAKIEAPTITLEDYEEIALNTIASKMGEFEEVQAVYTQKYQSEIVVYVFLKVEEYDEELMDRLLDKEYVIRKQFSDLVFNFLYPPTGIVAREDFVHPQARCIFHAERTYGGKIGTSFAG